mmetsp:Transcript_36250/g.78213  ORF Transcript_36250/g.78213 Transcript_36250/m.78213 type:complete len:82 (+) Transcript_36250:49-294(+)
MPLNTVATTWFTQSELALLYLGVATQCTLINTSEAVHCMTTISCHYCDATTQKDHPPHAISHAIQPSIDSTDAISQQTPSH